MEVVKGVYQIKIPLSERLSHDDDARPIKASKDKLVDAIEQNILGPRSVSYVNVYLIEGNKENLLIDTGWDTPDAFSALNKEFKNYGFTFKDISQIVITHFHPDHYGLAGKLKQICGGKIALSKVEADLLDSRYINPDELLKEIRRFLLAHGVPKKEVTKLSEVSMPAQKLVTPTKPDILLKTGKKIVVDPFEFKVLLTPGHSPGHICLYEPNRKLLFTGDHILPDITPHVGLHPQSGENPLGGYLSSLQELLKLEVNLAFPGHGASFSGVRQIGENLLRHHEQRRAAILKALQEDMKSGYQIAMELPWRSDIKPISFEALHVFDQRLAIMETLAHIESLCKDGKVQKIEQDGAILYFAGG